MIPISCLNKQQASAQQCGQRVCDQVNSQNFRSECKGQSLDPPLAERKLSPNRRGMCPNHKLARDNKPPDAYLPPSPQNILHLNTCIMLFSKTWSKKAILSKVKPLAAVTFGENHLGRFSVKGGLDSRRLTGQLRSEGSDAWQSPADPHHGPWKAGRDTLGRPRGLQAPRTHTPGCLPFLPRRPGLRLVP